MDGALAFFDQPDVRLADFSMQSTLLSMLMAFVIGQLIAWVYVWTHSGMSYSRAFTQSLVLITMVVALVMFVIGNSIITAFGLIGALAIIRFRNVLKDTRDTSFVFLSLVLGMAIGSQRYLTAILGTLVLMLVTAYLHFTGFGSLGHFDGHLACRLPDAAGPQQALRAILLRFCRHSKEITAHHGPELVEYVYQVRLRDPGRCRDLVSELRDVEGIGEVSLVLRDELAEL